MNYTSLRGTTFYCFLLVTVVFFTEILDKNKSKPNQFLVCHSLGLCFLLKFIYYDLTDNVLFFIIRLL